MSEQEDSNTDQLADAGIEYGGWGLLLFFFVRKCMHIARVNGIYANLSSPCRLGCVIDTNRGQPQEPDEPQNPQENPDSPDSSEIEMGDSSSDSTVVL
jgi:hypothetical protein